MPLKPFPEHWRQQAALRAAAFLPRGILQTSPPSLPVLQPVRAPERNTTLFSAAQLPISSLILTLQNTASIVQEVENKCRCWGCKGQLTPTTGCSLPPVFTVLRIRFKIIKPFIFKIYSLFSEWQRKVSSSASKEEFSYDQNIPNTASLGLVQCLLLFFCSSLYLLLLLLCYSPTCWCPTHSSLSITHLWKKLLIKIKHS